MRGIRRLVVVVRVASMRGGGRRGRGRGSVPHGGCGAGGGEVEGLSTSIAAAEDKIAQIEAQQEKKQSPVFLGLPSLAQLTARTSEAAK
ncbi:hypothetical protein [Streptomyces jumonjinensis]|uniref:Uncharacterized protein n=1 Tax=Streptomyces jumonjinensis TaxID=1945 RepID=A0A646KS25_STRJU|nr:hypothetical protein [Streptomyces jumonjinensis]MQT05139.1 hypothetical protein [Streptomyces jumonjinensis]